VTVINSHVLHISKEEDIMRIKKTKRLGLSKTTVANLNVNEMRAIKGGGFVEDQDVLLEPIPISSSSISSQPPIPISSSTVVTNYPA
jgi:natural product precursor